MLGVIAEIGCPSDTPGKRKLQLRKYLHQRPVSVSARASSSLLIGEGGSSQLWLADRCNDILFVF